MPNNKKNKDYNKTVLIKVKRLIGQSEEGEQRLWERHAQLIEMGLAFDHNCHAGSERCCVCGVLTSGESFFGGEKEPH